jgi:hypothetical protein
LKYSRRWEKRGYTLKEKYTQKGIPVPSEVKFEDANGLIQYHPKIIENPEDKEMREVYYLFYYSLSILTRFRVLH